ALVEGRPAAPRGRAAGRQYPDPPAGVRSEPALHAPGAGALSNLRRRGPLPRLGSVPLAQPPVGEVPRHAFLFALFAAHRRPVRRASVDALASGGPGGLRPGTDGAAEHADLPPRRKAVHRPAEAAV